MYNRENSQTIHQTTNPLLIAKQQKVHNILDRLYTLWPEPKTELVYTNPLQLLVATMLSAKTLDKTVNMVTPALFARYQTAADFANADFAELDKLIAKINFHRTKSATIIAACHIIATQHHGQVPQTMAELDALPGVARKTANVVMGNAFNNPQGIAVDTHVGRLSRNYGLTTHTDPVKIEQDLMAIVPKQHWIAFSHLLILYGRYHCPARKPRHECELLADLCV